jgi:hypothetical protein
MQERKHENGVIMTALYLLQEESTRRLCEERQSGYIKHISIGYDINEVWISVTDS